MTVENGKIGPGRPSFMGIENRFLGLGNCGHIFHKEPILNRFLSNFNTVFESRPSPGRSAYETAAVTEKQLCETNPDCALPFIQSGKKQGETMSKVASKSSEGLGLNPRGSWCNVGSVFHENLRACLLICLKPWWTVCQLAI